MLKTVCIDARMLHSSGIGTYLTHLLPLIATAPFRFVALGSPKDAHLFPKNVELISFTAPIYSAAEQLKFPLKIPKCDLFWSPHYNVPLCPIRAKKRIVTIHDVYHLAFYKTLSPLQKLYAKKVIHCAVKASNCIITDSQFSKTELISYTSVSESKVKAIPLGVDQNVFCMKNEEQTQAILSKYGIAEKFILFVSNLKPHKNIRGLIEAFAQLEQSDLRLVIVGKKEGFKTGEESEALLKLYPKIANRIDFLGQISREDLVALYSAAQALVFPSFYEGFGLPPLEAMAASCPVIAARAASLPEVCGTAALYVDPHAPAEIATAIQNVISTPQLREELKQKGLAHSKGFSWKRCAEEHVKLFDMELSQ